MFVDVFLIKLSVEDVVELGVWVVVAVTVLVITLVLESVADIVLVFDEVEESESVDVVRGDEDGKGLKLKLDVPVDVFV